MMRARLLRILLFAWWVLGNEGTAALSARPAPEIDPTLPKTVRLCYEPARQFCSRHLEGNHNELYMCLIVTLPNERTAAYTSQCWARLDWMRAHLLKSGARLPGQSSPERDANPTNARTSREHMHADARLPSSSRYRNRPVAARPPLPSTAAIRATALAEPDRARPRTTADCSQFAFAPQPGSAAVEQAERRARATRVVSDAEHASARARSAADIPRLIHQFTHLPDDDSKAHGLLRTEARVRAVHRGWCVRYWDDDELAAFVNASFAGAVADAYFKFPPGVIRSDIARYLLVATYGGWYLDTDIKCSQPLDTLHGRGGVVLTRTAPNPRKPPRPDFRPLVANFVFGSAPDHPFWELVLDEVASLPDPPREGLHDHLDIAMLSGPGLMQRAWARLGEAASATLGVVLEENARLGAWRSPIEKRVWDPYENTTVTPVCVHYNLFSWSRSSASGGASSVKLETRTALTKEEEDRRSRARRDWICSGGSATVMCRGHGSDRSGDDPNDDFV